MPRLPDLRLLLAGPMLAAVTLGGAVAAAASHPVARTGRGCYLVGRPVSVAGAGFAASRLYDIAIDGVDFGQSQTTATGGFSTSLTPGGLPRNVVQTVDQLDATDGTADAGATFTVTRPAGALFLSTRGDPRARRAPFEVFGFAPNGHRLSVYAHWVAPTGAAVHTAALGRTGGQCGFLRTPPMRLFPFAAGAGHWIVQVDTNPAYAARPRGPVARIPVSV